MELVGKRILVTGGCGFIGSHLIDALSNKDNEITIIDNISTGKLENIKDHLRNPMIKLMKGDLLKLYDLNKLGNHYDIIFHLAANPEVKEEDPNVHFEENIHSTFHVLELMKKCDVELIVFASTSTVYGEANVIPTPENFSPLIPISFYGASKLACESLICAYCNNYNKKGLICRMANIVGPRTEHSVVKDFVVKLKKDPHMLEILGDGTQDKSFLYVEDCVHAILHATKYSNENIGIFNVGSEDRISVLGIAKLILQEMKLENTTFKYVQKTEGGRGWKGDVKHMQLSIDKLKSIGWRPKYNSEKSVRTTVKYIVEK